MGEAAAPMVHQGTQQMGKVGDLIVIAQKRLFLTSSPSRPLFPLILIPSIIRACKLKSLDYLVNTHSFKMCLNVRKIFIISYIFIFR